jgi:polypeptide N-acetylgalactosaminyltransferase
LDSHSEIGLDFLEPLLDRIQYHPNAVLSPILDTLTAKKYKKNSDTLKGGFDWNLRFKWIPMSEEEREKRDDPSQPFISPTTLGGTFLVRKKRFLELGGFDDQMQVI